MTNKEKVFIECWEDDKLLRVDESRKVVHRPENGPSYVGAKSNGTYKELISDNPPTIKEEWWTCEADTWDDVLNKLGSGPFNVITNPFD